MGDVEKDFCSSCEGVLIYDRTVRDASTDEYYEIHICSLCGEEYTIENN